MKVPPLSYKEIIKKAKRLGFAFRRNTSGSHEIWWNEKSRKTCVIPHHHEIASGTVRNIIRQMDVSAEEFLKA